MDASPLASLHVCVTCGTGAAGEPVRGLLLHDALSALLPSGPPELRLSRVTCLANCGRGCSAAITMPGKWSYLLGGLDAGHAADLLTYARAYIASASGTVLPRRRPASLREMVVGRLPPAEALS
jgi:predicted metal-binding protein